MILCYVGVFICNVIVLVIRMNWSLVKDLVGIIGIYLGCVFVFCREKVVIGGKGMCYCLREKNC